MNKTKLIIGLAVMAIAAFLGFSGLTEQSGKLDRIQTTGYHRIGVEHFIGSPNITYAERQPCAPKCIEIAAQRKEGPRPCPPNCAIAAQRKEHPCWPWNCEKLDKKWITIRLAGGD